MPLAYALRDFFVELGVSRSDLASFFWTEMNRPTRQKVHAVTLRYPDDRREFIPVSYDQDTFEKMKDLPHIYYTERMRYEREVIDKLDLLYEVLTESVDVGAADSLSETIMLHAATNPDKIKVYAKMIEALATKYQAPEKVYKFLRNVIGQEPTLQFGINWVPGDVMGWHRDTGTSAAKTERPIKIASVALNYPLERGETSYFETRDSNTVASMSDKRELPFLFNPKEYEHRVVFEAPGRLVLTLRFYDIDSEELISRFKTAGLVTSEL